MERPIVIKSWKIMVFGRENTRTDMLESEVMLVIVEGYLLARILE